MAVSKINSTAFKGSIIVQAREGKSLFEKPHCIDAAQIRKINNLDKFTVIKMGKEEFFVQKDEVPYKKLMQAYNLAKNTDVTVDFVL